MTAVIEVVDSVATLRDVLIERIAGSQFDGLPVRTNKRGDGDVPPFYVVSEGGAIRHRTGPGIAPARVNLSGWGVDADQAAELYLVASQQLHRYGPEVRSSGVGIFKIFDETGAQQPFEDPDTGWWRAFGVFDLVLLDRIVA